MRRTLAGLLLLIALPAMARGDGAQLRRDIAASLVTAEATQTRAFRWQREPEIIALYFGADWCAPCHAFVPTLRQVRDALRAAGADTEVVYVSQDESESQMRRYMRAQQMPWPAIDYRRIQRLPALQRLAGEAPPNLVLIDRDGAVLASAWQGLHYRGPAAVLREWITVAAPDGTMPPLQRPADAATPVPAAANVP